MERYIHTLPKVTINAYLRSFQYKILNNILYLNKKLHTFGLSNTQLCFFLQNGKRDNKSPILLLHSYSRYLESSSDLLHCFHFSHLRPQTAIFGFHNIDNDTFFIQNHN